MQQPEYKYARRMVLKGEIFAVLLRSVMLSAVMVNMRMVHKGGHQERDATECIPSNTEPGEGTTLPMD
jgi:hypothetical protein